MRVKKLFDDLITYIRRNANSSHVAKDLLNIFGTFVVLVGFLAVIFLVKQGQDVRGQAAGTTFDYYGKSIQTFGLFGQKSVYSTTRNDVSGSTQEHAPGVVVDKSSTPNKVYVVDSGDSRVLGYNGIGTCSNNSTLSCTVNLDCGAGGVCNVPSQVINTKKADIVIGQADMSSGACNGDNNLGWNKKPTASTLCLLAYPWGNNTAEQWQANNIDVDSQGNLYITDTYNNRVLEYYQPFSADKTGGKGDSVADYVWGQNDFVSNGRNRGSNNGWTNIALPDDHSLWAEGLGPKCYGDGNPGVSADLEGNVWVSDSCNHRILRFAQNSKIANLVIGEPDFVTNSGDCTGTSLNKLCGTMQARINPDTGELYVLDRYKGSVGFISRILVFKAPFTNGMLAYKVIVPKAGNFVGWGAWDGKGTYAFQGSGFTFNPDKVNYPTGILWVTEHDANRVLLIDTDGNIVKVVNAIDANHRGGNIPSGCPFFSNNGNGMGYGLYWPSSAVSFDSENNMYITAEEFSSSSHIVRFALPYNTFVNSSGTTCLPLPNGGINWIAPLSNDTIWGGRGLITYQNQLISLHDQSFENVYGGVHNGGKLMVWNDYQTKSISAPADLTYTATEITNVIHSSAVDDKGRWWGLNNDLMPIIYQLPITNNNPTALLKATGSTNPFYWADDGTQITNLHLTGFAFDKINNVLYVIDHGSRIFRIKNYDQYTSKLYVDMVLGPTDKNNVSCNQGLASLNAGTLCQVREVKFDNFGNLYVVDDDYECHGNRRITVFLAGDLKNANGMFPGLQAKLVFNEPDFTSTANCAYWVHDAPGTPVSIAFDSQNHMVVGNDGYYDQAYDSERELKQLWYYSNPLRKQTPDASISLYMGTPGDMVFDSNDNLLIQDSTWNRILMINLCTDPVWLTYLPGVVPGLTCPLSNYTATATPSSTPILPSPSSVPTPSPLITPVPGLDTILPEVTIIFPTNGQVINSNKNITITANASDNVGIIKVEFWVNQSLICTDLQANYTCRWKVPALNGATYTIVAKAFDTSNNTKTDQVVVTSK